jgi:RNA polymerase sigma-70 factor (ECF subfamily)
MVEPQSAAGGADPLLLELTQAACAGDRAALHRLIEHHLPDVHAFVRLRAGPALRANESTSDLVQSACRELLENASEFRFASEGAFRRWLFTTALRKIQHRAEYYRAGKRDGRGDFVPISGSRWDACLADSYRHFSSPSGHAALREQIERVEKAFAELTEEQREVVTLAHLAGLSRAEIAEEIGKSEGAVRVILHRALAKLSGLLQP